MNEKKIIKTVKKIQNDWCRKHFGADATDGGTSSLQFLICDCPLASVCNPENNIASLKVE